MKSDFSNDEAKRIALASQGFTDPRPRGRIDARHFRRVMSRVKLAQIDSVNVAVRAHYMPFYSRLGSYERDNLDMFAYKRGNLCEHWAHEASFLPVKHYPLLRPRMGSRSFGRNGERFIREHAEYIDAVLEEVRDRGALSIRDLSDPGKNSNPWWGWGKGKLALEWLFATGRLAVAHRKRFVRYYDLPERVIPVEILASPKLTREEAHRSLLLHAAEAHGIGTAKDLADYYRLPVPVARPRLAELVDGGELLPVRVKEWKDPAYLHPRARLPRRVEGGTLISPFDSLIWERKRAERIFNFQYRIEIYVPAPKRIYGYYVLPFLLNGELTARVDLKADRKAGKLLVQSAFLEDGPDERRVARELMLELVRFAGWLGLETIRIGRKGNLTARLRKEQSMKRQT